MPAQITFDGSQDPAERHGVGQLLLERVVDHGTRDNDEVINHRGVDGAELMRMSCQKRANQLPQIK